ncbi:MAG: hypothetical protein B5766_10835 [Candidatus Lumbricidophila eiseniae]|uniref:DUF4192 domain-containing protein n=1 Tax=Candidatus Lumbricidiphila eiseniae TaxID=1969409 RepID=A0A2A6FPL3_9MICO|nr:MAG: hypothetical protein B5766_10835 [Candidatus Lumbricidophila eiseniae]
MTGADSEFTQSGAGEASTARCCSLLLPACGCHCRRVTAPMTVTTGLELLDLVPALLGFRPRTCIVIIALRGTSMTGAIRLDLPDPGPPTTIEHTAVGILSRMSVDTAIPLVYADDAVVDNATVGNNTVTDQTGTGRMSRLTILVALVRAMRMAGFTVPDGFLCLSSAWYSLHSPFEPRVWPPQDRFAQEAQAVTARGVSPVLDSAADLATVPPRCDAVASAVARELARLNYHHSRWLEPVRSGGPSGVPGALQALLTDRFVELSPHTLARALAALCYAPQRDALILEAAFGPRRGRPGNEDRALIIGESTVAPDRDNIVRVREVMMSLIAHAPTVYRCDPLCVAAWFQWAQGHGSAAARLVGYALQTNSEHPFARLFRRRLADGVLPEWVYHAREPHDTTNAAATTMSDATFPHFPP